MPRLRSHVHVTDPNGDVTVLTPGEGVPRHLADRVTNPKAWDPATAPDPGPHARPAADPDPAPPRPRRKTTSS